MDARIQQGAPVSFWNYMTTVGGYAQCALVFGRVVGIGSEWVTIVTEHGNRTRRRVQDLTYSPDGEEILRKRNI